MAQMLVLRPKIKMVALCCEVLGVVPSLAPVVCLRCPLCIIYAAP